MVDLQRGHLAQTHEIEFCLQRVEMKFEKITHPWSVEQGSAFREFI